MLREDASMRTHNGLLYAAALLMVGSALVIESFQPARAANSDTVAATYSQGTLRVTIPYRAPHDGAGRLTVEVLSPEDEILGHAEHLVGASDGKGWWQED